MRGKERKRSNPGHKRQDIKHTIRLGTLHLNNHKLNCSLYCDPDEENKGYNLDSPLIFFLHTHLLFCSAYWLKSVLIDSFGFLVFYLPECRVNKAKSSYPKLWLQCSFGSQEPGLCFQFSCNQPFSPVLTHGPDNVSVALHQRISLQCPFLTRKKGYLSWH